MTPQETPVYARLEALGIEYSRYEHPAVATAEAADVHWSVIDAVHCKNLFLRNQKGTRHYLLIVPHLKRANLRAVADQIGDGKLSFGSADRLMAHLGVTPGSVSPFGLLHNTTRDVRVVLDRDLELAPDDLISFHPNINTVTVTLKFGDFERFLAACGNPIQHVTV